MSTFGRNARIPTDVRCLAWTIALLLPFTGWAAADDMTATSVPAGNPPAAQPKVWLCAGERIMELLQPGAEWPFVKQHLTGIKLYIGQLHGKRLETREQTIERLRPLVRFVRAHDLQVAVELGGCLDFSPMGDTAGEWSARHELAALANFYAAGGQVDFLDLDGPIRRLLHPENRRDGRRFDSIDQAADELVDALKLHRAAHPETKYWLLTNFPNWGWRGDVSYHARGPQRQDYGDYDRVVRIVLEKLRAAAIRLDGVTVDNPYDYLVGEHFSVKLADPKSVDWLARVRSYEDFAREQGLTFNLIVNSQRGGQESDERFFRETLQMVDTYQRAGGRPTRWFVQSWYPHPQQMLPETAPPSMTALVKAVIERVRGEMPECAARPRAAPIRPIQADSAEPTGAVRPIRVMENAPCGREAPETLDGGTSGPRPELSRLALEGLPAPEPGRPGVLGFRVRAPWMRGWIEQRFPETIHSSLGLHFIDHRRPDMPPLSMLEPFPAWDRDEDTGEISYSHKDRTGLVFSGRARPYLDQVVLEYRIRNETGGKLHNISAQMCTNLGPSPNFDPKEDVTRTFTWVDGQWTSLADTTPHLARTGRHPWILMQVRGTDYRGPRENPDGWWVADQIADQGIVVRVTRDGEHLAAVHWDSAPMVMSNSRIPCLHAGPAGGVSLDPGQEVVWRGTIYLMENDPDKLLRRYLAARENSDESDRRQADGPFQIVRSFPVSEATWAAKVGDLYLVAAQRSVLVYRKTGPAAPDYREVNRIFPGVDGRIENCEIAGQRLYVPASGQGLLAYRLEDLEKPDVQPIARYAGPRRIGAISVAGGRVYAAYREGGLGVFDARTLELLGGGLLETGIGRAGLTAVPGGIVYTTQVPEYGELLVVDARNPDRLSVAGRVRNAAYATHYRFPGSVAGDRMYMPEGNGGVGVYDITAPLQPLLQRRHAAVGDSPPRGARALPGQVRAFAVQDGIGYLVRDREVVAVRIDADGFEELGAVSQSKLSGAGLLDPQAVSVRDGVAAIPTTMEGVRFIDVANAGRPEPLLTIDLPSRFEGLAKVGRMVYATADIDGVWQIDWEAAGGPRLSRRIETRPKALPGESLAEDLTLHRNHLYVADGLGLAVIDVSDEDDPRQVFYWDYPYPGGVPDISAGWVEGVGVSGDTLYVTLGPAGLATFDVSDPASPVRLRTIALDGTWGKDVVVQPRRQLAAYAGREQFALLDVSDPQQPVVLSSTPVERRRHTAGAVFSPDGNQLVVVQQGMFSVYDVHDPQSPSLVASVEGHGSEDAVFFHDYLLVSGRGAGVGVWRVGRTAAELTRVQTLPCHFYNSKFWVEGERIFTNSEGIDEIRLKP